MGLLDTLFNIISKGVAKGVSDVVENAVAEAVKPAATKLAKKQADLIDSVADNIETANKSMKEAGETAERNPEQVKMAMEVLRRNAHRAAEEIEKLEYEKPLTDDEVMAQWSTLLPDYPEWQCGGNHFDLCEDDLGDGRRCVRFNLNAAEANWIAYKASLAGGGFKLKYRGDTSTWYKEVDGRYPAVHLFHIDYDACEMQLVFYLETKEEIDEAAKL